MNFDKKVYFNLKRSVDRPEVCFWEGGWRNKKGSEWPSPSRVFLYSRAYSQRCNSGRSVFTRWVIYNI